jgi:hypothetical protein
MAKRAATQYYFPFFCVPKTSQGIRWRVITPH